jgi:hypothetical protein
MVMSWRSIPMLPQPSGNSITKTKKAICHLLLMGAETIQLPKIMLWRNHLILPQTLLGAPPPQHWHPLIVMVPYYLYSIVEKFPFFGNAELSPCAPAPMEAGSAQEGLSKL